MKRESLSLRVTKLADCQLRIHARYESLNGFIETARLLHELLAKIDSLQTQLKKVNHK